MEGGTAKSAIKGMAVNHSANVLRLLDLGNYLLPLLYDKTYLLLTAVYDLEQFIYIIFEFFNETLREILTTVIQL